MSEINKIMRKKRDLTMRSLVDVGRSRGFFLRQESTKRRKTSDQFEMGWSAGLSFCAIWYKALIAFILKYGGFRSAVKSKESVQKHNN